MSLLNGQEMESSWKNPKKCGLIKAARLQPFSRKWKKIGTQFLSLLRINGLVVKKELQMLHQGRLVLQEPGSPCDCGIWLCAVRHFIFLLL